MHGIRHCYFWRTAHGAELDLLVLKNGKMYGFEFKMSEAPGISRSMRIARENLKLDHLYIVAPVKDSYQVEERITVNTLYDALNTIP